MTQDVQPLTWQKRTNLEEHQQFFSKINEIIDNLAPTVDEAEQAIAQATQAITDANAAIATANAASAAADAAAQQAQTAASTVAGYDTRLTAVEGEADTNAGNITALQGRMGTAEGKITAIEGREADYLKKGGAAQTVTSQIMVPTTVTGLRDTQIANGTRIQNDLDNYAPMVRTTGNTVKTGNFTVEGRLLNKFYSNYGNFTLINPSDDNTDNTLTDRRGFIVFADKNDVPIIRIGYSHDGTTRDLKVRFYKADGTWFPDIVLGQVTE